LQKVSQLDFRSRELVAYGGSTINYGARYRDGKAVLTAAAESAVNQGDPAAHVQVTTDALIIPRRSSTGSSSMCPYQW
jgi:hypothetical protein